VKDSNRNTVELRAVSEIVAILIVTIIVISVGGVLILKLRNIQDIWYGVINDLQEKANSLSSEPSYTIAYSYVNITGSYICIILNVAPGSLTISSVYLENSRVNENLTYIVVDGQQVNISKNNNEFTLIGGNVHEVRLNLSQSLIAKLNNSNVAILKIVSKSGISEISSASVVK
jgi:hypothetical protein